MDEDLLKYKGYFGELSFDLDAEVIRGSVTNTREHLRFQGNSIQEAIQAFRDTVDDYLGSCESHEQEHEKPINEDDKSIAMNQAKHKGYVGELSVDVDSGVILGTVLNTPYTIKFKGRTVEEARLAFREAVDDYLLYSASVEEEPRKPFDQNSHTFAILEDACRAALIFCPPYNASSRREWLKITGSSEFSTSILRPILMRALEQAGRLRDAAMEV